MINFVSTDIPPFHTGINISTTCAFFQVEKEPERKKSIIFCRFSEDGCEEAVYLTGEQKELFNDWLSLSPEQKDVVEKLIKSYKLS